MADFNQTQTDSTQKQRRLYGEPENNIEYCLSPSDIIYSKTCPLMIIREFNSTFVEVSGWSKEELVGRGHNILRHSDMPDEVFADLKRTITSGRIWRGIVKNKRKDGSFYWVDATITPITDNGMIVGYQSLRSPATEAQKQKAIKDYKLIKEGKKKVRNSLSTLKYDKKQRYNLYSSLGLLASIEIAMMFLGLYGDLVPWMVILSLLVSLYLFNNIRGLVLLDDENSKEFDAIRDLARGNFRTDVPIRSVYTEPLELIRAKITQSVASATDCNIKDSSLTVLMDNVRGKVIFTNNTMDFRIINYSVSALQLEEQFGKQIGEVNMADYLDKKLQQVLSIKYDKQKTILTIGNKQYDTLISPIVYGVDIKSYLFLMYEVDAPL